MADTIERRVGDLEGMVGDIPRLINMICDRALLGGYSAQTTRIDVDIVAAAAAGLDLAPAAPARQSWFSRFRRAQSL